MEAHRISIIIQFFLVLLCLDFVIGSNKNPSKTKPKEKLCTFNIAASGFAKNIDNPLLVAKGRFGDDAWFSASSKNADIIGIADGVGGWKDFLKDTAKFSTTLMSTCKNNFLSSKKLPISLFNNNYYDPGKILVKSYDDLKKKLVYGGCTACIIVLEKHKNMLHTANLGDSGFLVIRDGKIFQKSEPNFHDFNVPHQLSVPPPKHEDLSGDSPNLATKESFKVEAGDVILLATDGVWDNIFEHDLIPQLTPLNDQKNKNLIQDIAKNIAKIAYKNSISTKKSPFAEAAIKAGMNYQGGKRDDITVVLATVNPCEGC